MAMRERRTCRAAIVANGIVTDLGRARFAFHTEPRRDQIVAEGWTIATVSPSGESSFDMPIPLAALDPEEPRGTWPCARGELHLGPDAERLVADAERGRREHFYRRTGPEFSARARATPLYVDPRRYEHEGIL